MISNVEITDKMFKYDVPLYRYTSFKIGGMAEFFAEPKDLSELEDVLRFCKEENKKVFVLGNGSNVLISDEGVKGVVVHLGGVGFKDVKRDGKYVFSGGGANLSQLIRETALWGLGGLEVLAGIPGTVGGAVMMNAGGQYGNISETIRSITTMDFNGKIGDYEYKDIGFTYRGCDLKEQIVIEAKFMLKESEKDRILERMSEINKEKTERQPLNTLNAGSIFKNTQDYKAAKLIEQAGLKGKEVGGAVVSRKHANFIVNTGDATSTDILDLIKIIKETVKDKYNISLETEIQIW